MKRRRDIKRHFEPVIERLVEIDKARPDGLADLIARGAAKSADEVVDAFIAKAISEWGLPKTFLVKPGKRRKGVEGKAYAAIAAEGRLGPSRFKRYLPRARAYAGTPKELVLEVTNKYEGFPRGKIPDSVRFDEENYENDTILTLQASLGGYSNGVAAAHLFQFCSDVLGMSDIDNYNEELGTEIHAGEILWKEGRHWFKGKSDLKHFGYI